MERGARHNIGDVARLTSCTSGALKAALSASSPSVVACEHGAESHEEGDGGAGASSSVGAVLRA